MLCNYLLFVLFTLNFNLNFDNQLQRSTTDDRWQKKAAQACMDYVSL